MDRQHHLGDMDKCRCEIQFGYGSFSTFFSPVFLSLAFFVVSVDITLTTTFRASSR